MVHKIMTATPFGLDAKLVEVEADVTNGLPATVIVGLPDTAVQESRVRIRSAIKHVQFTYPQTKVSINLAPGDVPKIGTHFDLPIALAVLQASGLINIPRLEKMLFIGELSLDGNIRPCSGTLSMIMTAKAHGFETAFVPDNNAAEASLVQGIQVYAVQSLEQLLQHLTGVKLLEIIVSSGLTKLASELLTDFKDVAGQQLAKRALEIAAAGNHNVRMIGPPGSGKSMLAKAFSGILPPLEESESLELTKIYSIAGLLRGNAVTTRPVRSPHHTASATSLIGGGAIPKPGDVTLAHKGVLFLDEFPEFARSVLEVLRQPLEDGVVTVSRVKNTFTFPADFVLVAAQNPCPCGSFGDPLLTCSCLPGEIQKYNRKISGPLLDRIDMHISVPRLKYEVMMESQPAESSTQIAARVLKARIIQYRRLGEAFTNSRMTSKDIKKYCQLDESSTQLIKQASVAFALSGRSIHRILKVSRTIADLDGSINIRTQDIAEAIQYRAMAK